ncbi:MAG: hypothetical protein AAGI24_03685 [Pseudomonadota bacterium]
MVLNKSNIALGMLSVTFGVSLWNTLSGCGPVADNQIGGLYIDAGEDQTVNEGTEVTLVAKTSSNSGVATFDSVSWDTKFSTESGFSAPFTEQDTLTFTAPFVEKTESLELEARGLLTGPALVARDTVTVTILDTGAEEPVPEFNIIIAGGILNFAHIIGGSPCPQFIGTFTIENSGAGELDWFVGSSPAWVTLTPSSGVAPSEVTARFPCSGFQNGDNVGNIQLQSSDGQEASVPVSGSVN